MRVRINSASRERRAHQPVPRGQDLVVQVRAGAPSARFQQRRLRACDRDRVLGRRRLVQDVLAGELTVRIVIDITVFAHAVAAHKCVGRAAGDPANLIRAPDVKRPLAFEIRMRRIDHAIRVLGRVERAAGVRHISQNVIERAPSDVRILTVTRKLERFHVRGRELRLVVQHLLEVRYEPPIVYRVTVKSAAELIVHAAARHLAEGEQHHIARLVVLRAHVVSQQEIEY
jgi:hypothetical protein